MKNQSERGWKENVGNHAKLSIFDNITAQVVSREPEPGMITVTIDEPEITPSYPVPQVRVRSEIRFRTECVLPDAGDATLHIVADKLRREMSAYLYNHIIDELMEIFMELRVNGCITEGVAERLSNLINTMRP